MVYRIMRARKLDFIMKTRPWLNTHDKHLIAEAVVNGCNIPEMSFIQE